MMTNPGQKAPDWEKMYAILCGKVSDALDVLPLLPANIKAYEILQSGLDAAEELYCQGGGR